MYAIRSYYEMDETFITLIPASLSIFSIAVLKKSSLFPMLEPTATNTSIIYLLLPPHSYSVITSYSIHYTKLYDVHAGSLPLRRDPFHETSPEIVDVEEHHRGRGEMVDDSRGSVERVREIPDEPETDRDRSYNFV